MCSSDLRANGRKGPRAAPAAPARRAPRRAAAGDTAPVLQTKAVEEFAVGQAVAAANAHEIAAIDDILAGEAPQDRKALLATLVAKAPAAHPVLHADEELS